MKRNLCQNSFQISSLYLQMGLHFEIRQYPSYKNFYCNFTKRLTSISGCRQNFLMGISRNNGKAALKYFQIKCC